MDGFVCCYCDDPAAIPSEGHIFPDAIGGVTAPRDTVCRACNSLVNTRVENPAVERFAFLRSGLGLRSRRGTIPKVRAFIESMGQKLELQLGEDGMPVAPGIVRQIPVDTGTGFVILGEGDWASRRKEELALSRPATTWKDIEVPDEFGVPFEDEPDNQFWRRMAAKVAFERFAQLRGSSITKEVGFDPIRRFILEGLEAAPLVGLICDPAWISEGGGLWFKMPQHAVAIAVTPASRPLFRIDAAVSFFGLYQFWVRVCPSFFTLAASDDLLVEHPQAGTTQNPVLRYRLTVPQLPVEAWAARSARQATKVREQAKEYAFNKFHAALAALPDDPEDAGGSPSADSAQETT